MTATDTTRRGWCLGVQRDPHYCDLTPNPLDLQLCAVCWLRWSRTKDGAA